MNCEYCGSRIDENAVSCRGCGAPNGSHTSPMGGFMGKDIYPDSSGTSIGYVVSDHEDVEAFVAEWKRVVTHPDDILRYDITAKYDDTADVQNGATLFFVIMTAFAAIVALAAVVYSAIGG